MKTYKPSKKTSRRMLASVMCLLCRCFMQRVFAQPGQAHLFNGSNQYDSISYKSTSSIIAYEYTVEAWVRPLTVANGTTMTIFSTRGAGGLDYSFDMKIVNGNTLHADIGNGSLWLTTSADVSYSFAAGRWCHIAYVVSFSTHKYLIYINGVQVATNSLGSDPIGVFLFDANHLKGYIGANPRIGAEYFNGAIDEVKAYQGLLSQAQIQADMVGNPTGVAPALYYNFNEGSGSTATDAANNSTCKLVNSPLWSDSYAMVIPYNITLTPTAGGFTTTWTKPQGTVNSYKLQVSTNANFNPLVAGYGPDLLINNLTAIEVFGLQKGTSYYYRIIADNNVLTGQGALMAPIAFTTVLPASITSFSPAAAPVGTSVVINGTGFSSTATSNVVRFGGVRAVVTNASATQLMVKVPAGAGYSPITVNNTANNTTGVSSDYFNTTYSGGDKTFGKNSFAAPVQAPAQNLGDFIIRTADFDGDGKLDLAGFSTGIANNQSQFIVSRNTSSAGNFSFAAPVAYSIPAAATENMPVIADFNGDGKLDIVDVSSYDKMQVFTNTSTTGSITFAAGTIYTIKQYAFAAGAGDMDGDGKPDLIIVNNNSTDGSTVKVFRNTSSATTISFETSEAFAHNYTSNFVNTDFASQTMAVADFNKDGKPDILVSDVSGTDIILLKNASTRPGNFSFSVSQLATGSGMPTKPRRVIAGDYNGDGQPDIAVTYLGSGIISLFVNTSTTGGTITFGTRTDYTAPTDLRELTAVDINGDGKIDLAGTITSNLYVMLNTNNGNNINFTAYGPYINYDINGGNVAAADLNGDGKPEVAMISVKKMYIFQPQAGLPHMASFSPGTLATDSVMTIKGSNFLNVTTVKIGGVAAKAFTVLNDTTITATVNELSWDNSRVLVANSLGADSLTGFTFIPKPGVSYVDPNIGYRNTIVTIHGSSFTNVRSVKFGGIDARFFSVQDQSTILASPSAAGASGSLTVATNGGIDSVPFTFVYPPVITSFSPASAGYGDTVTIKGHNFLAVQSVYPNFNKSNNFIVVDSTTIKLLIDYNTDNSFISVVNIAGSATSATRLTALPMSATISGPATVCNANGAAYITFTGVHCAPGVSFTYYLNNGGTKSIASDANTVTGRLAIPTTPGTYTYNLTGLDDNYNDAHGGASGTVKVVVGAPVTTTTNVTVCSNALPYIWNGNTYNTAGTYSVLLTSIAGCDSTAKLVLNIAQAPVAAYAAIDTAICYGGLANTSVTASGGITPYLYSFDNGSYQTSNLFNAGVGTHNVTVKDAAGCIVAANPITITGPEAPLTLSLSSSTNCAGDNDTVKAKAHGGYGNYAYSINNGVSYQAGVFTGLSGGLKTIIAKDVHGCVISNTVSVKVFTVTYATTKSNICYGALATTVATAAGGKTPYGYSLDGTTYQTGTNFKVAGGTYSVTVKDARGCIITSAPLVITQPAAPLALAVQAGKTVCDNMVTVTATGGFGGYLYSNNGGALQAGNIFTGVAAGENTLLVQDAAGCKQAKTVTLKTPLTATAAATSTQLCYGASANITVTAKLGLSPYQFSLNGAPYQASNTFKKVGGGNYTVNVQDAAGCVFTVPAINIQQSTQAIAVTAVTSNVTCLNGTDGAITVAAANGYGSYLYSNNNGAYQPDNTFTGLPAGFDTIRVKDEAGCIGTVRLRITQPNTACAPLTINGTENPTRDIAEMHGELKVEILPNPAQVEFNMRVTRGDSRYTVELKVMDMYGKEVYHTRGSVFDMFRFGSTFAGGIYFAEILNGNNRQAIKLVKGN